jgi:hypothetical protein
MTTLSSTIAPSNVNPPSGAAAHADGIATTPPSTATTAARHARHRPS